MQLFKSACLLKRLTIDVLERADSEVIHNVYKMIIDREMKKTSGKK